MAVGVLTENDAANTGATAVAFPGMGPTRFADVARFLVINPAARRSTAAADRALGYSLLDEWEKAEGDYSEYAQVAFFISCLALAEWARAALGVEPAVCTGPSFGAKAAAVYSGALSFEDGVVMTAKYARCLDEYFAVEHRDAVTRSFTRTPGARLAPILQELDELGEWYEVTCQVDDDLHMLTLAEGRVEWLDDKLRAFGGFPLYTMRPPLHSGAFGPLRDRLEEEVFGQLEFEDPRIPVVADQDGRLVDTAEGVKDLLLEGVVRPVCWPAAVRGVRDQGVSTLYMSGPDSLFGRVGCTRRAFDVVPLDPPRALRPVPRPRTV